MVKPGKMSVESSFVQYADGQYEWAEMAEELNIMPVGWTSCPWEMRISSMSSYMMERKGGECQTVSQMFLRRGVPQKTEGWWVEVALVGGGESCVLFGDVGVCSERVSRESLTWWSWEGLVGDWAG
jgi:hypothetical protein